MLQFFFRERPMSLHRKKEDCKGEGTPKKEKRIPTLGDHEGREKRLP